MNHSFDHREFVGERFCEKTAISASRSESNKCMIPSTCLFARPKVDKSVYLSSKSALITAVQCVAKKDKANAIFDRISQKISSAMLHYSYHRCRGSPRWKLANALLGFLFCRIEKRAFIESHRDEFFDCHSISRGILISIIAKEMSVLSSCINDKSKGHWI